MEQIDYIRTQKTKFILPIIFYVSDTAKHLKIVFQCFIMLVMIGTQKLPKLKYTEKKNEKKKR